MGPQFCPRAEFSVGDLIPLWRLLVWLYLLIATSFIFVGLFNSNNHNCFFVRRIDTLLDLDGR